MQMVYQLPNGKVVYLSIEEYLSLTHEDIQYLIAGDYGDHIINPFKGSSIDKNYRTKSYDFNNVQSTDDQDNIISDDDIIDFTGPMD
tara:strand:+ start:221 stop:481 length:261 start_codon:yes stop_codon:yes gene_type:complete